MTDKRPIYLIMIGTLLLAIGAVISITSYISWMMIPTITLQDTINYSVSSDIGVILRGLGSMLIVAGIALVVLFGHKQE